MVKKTFAPIITTGLLLVLIGAATVHANNGIIVTNSSVEVEFPYQLTFEIEAESDSEIKDIRLHYQVHRDHFAVVTSEIITDLIPDKKVATSWKWDLIKSGGLPAGTFIEYWWTITDSEAEIVQTEKYRIQFNDERYSWRSITEGEITIYWYQGREDFAWQLMATAQMALEELETDTGAQLQKPVSIYIYANAADLQGAMIFPQEWTGGVAFTTYGTVAIGINTGNLEWGRRTIVHELTHLVTQQMTFNPYNSLPVWLNEGLSMYAEGEIQPLFESYLRQAVLDDELLSVRSLASPFSTDTGLSYLSYAQSMSIVDFLIDNYGKQKMLELLNTFKIGSSYDGAFTKVYGFDIDGLSDRWSDHIFNVYGQVLAR
ncbi:MAG: peptidase MA domain-containing protein [Dehalococcoidia bacterium]|nr:MAG: peptidase MA domain-containing protein [Dehalococcoidia bacterium]